MMKRNDKKTSWNGYTLEEIRYRRLLNVAHEEIERERLTRQFNETAKTASSLGMTAAPLALIGGSTPAIGVLKKMLGALSYMDYAIVAFKVGQRLFDTIRLWRGKKNAGMSDKTKKAAKSRQLKK